MKHKAKINLVVDIIIGLSFIAVAATGVVLFFAGSGGYQGGRNPNFTPSILALDRNTWKTIHDWSGIVMSAGALVHLVLHWNWIVCMVKNMFKSRKTQQASVKCER